MYSNFLVLVPTFRSYLPFWFPAIVQAGMWELHKVALVLLRNKALASSLIATEVVRYVTFPTFMGPSTILALASND